MNMLALANPDLDNPKLSISDAAAEIEGIRQTCPSAIVYSNKEATKAKITGMNPHINFLHFAVHGIFMPDKPLQSGLLMASGRETDGYLTVAEIFKLSFKGRMVMVTADQTHAGSSSRGLDIVLFRLAWLHAGSASVVDTLWDSADASKALLVKKFYQYLGKGENIAEALRASQMDIIDLGYGPHEWASFAVSGKY